MNYSDMHTHGCYSDGRGCFSDFIISAEKKGLVSIGFSDHSPVPLSNEWSMEKESLGRYFEELTGIKKQATETLNIYAGLELDYIPGIDVKEYIRFKELPLDYFIGSVHYVYSDILGKYLEVDGSYEDFKFLVEVGFNGNAKAVYKSYYNNVRDMISSYIPAVAAHIDLVTKNNKSGLFFDENNKEYLDEVEETLDLIKLFGTIIEINTGGMSRGYMKRPYPSEYILKKCVEKKIPVTLNSDSHSPENLAYEFNIITEHIKSIGFEELIIYKRGNWTPIRL